jgi:hypothetical protein
MPATSRNGRLVVVVLTDSLDRKRLGEEIWSNPLNLVRGVFDKAVRRKPQVFVAVAVIEVGIMDIE